MYQAQTRGVRVTAAPRFMEAESSHAQGRYFWAYSIEIVNLSEQTVQLMTRHWIITDGRGYNATSLEFRVTSWLSLLASIDTLGRGTAAGEYRRDY